MRTLLAPVTITPTKPLTPAHLKFLLSMDVLYKSTGLISEIRCLYHHGTFARTRQVLAFWEYLDRVHPGLDYRVMSEEEIGELYVRHARAVAESGPPSHEALTPYLERVEAGGWTHPSSRRLLGVWAGHYGLLNIFDERFGRAGPALMSTEELLDGLAARGLVLDMRAVGGPVYLDLTASGHPLRLMISAEGRANYLACALRELLPLAGRYDRIVLAHDEGLTADYVLLDRVLAAFGARVHRVGVHRVPLGGVARSTRYGGWQGYTLGALTAGGLAEDLAAFRLGMRLYLIAVLGKGGSGSFEVGGLRRWVGRAAALLDRAGAEGVSPDAGEFLRGLAGGRGHVDPYRLTSALLSRGRRVPVRDLLDTVYA